MNDREPKELVTIEVVVDEYTSKFLQEVAEATDTTPDQCASILVYLEFRKLLKEETNGEVDQAG